MKVQAQRTKDEGSLILTDTDGQTVTFVGKSIELVTPEFFERDLGKLLIRERTLRLVPRENKEQAAPAATPKAPEVPPIVEVTQDSAKKAEETSSPETVEPAKTVTEATKSVTDKKKTEEGKKK